MNSSRHYDEEEGLATAINSSISRRDVKKPIQVKKNEKKEKLWESIVSQAAAEADGSSSSDNE